MQRRLIVLVLVTIVTFALADLLKCEAGDVHPPQACSPTASHYGQSGLKPRVSPYAPAAQAVAGHSSPQRRALQPLPQPTPRVCGPVPQKVRAFPDLQACDSKLVPLYVRDPGPVRPIIQHSVGLAGATLALPFRIAEILCPLPTRTCVPKTAAPCGPVPNVPLRAPVCQPIPPASNNFTFGCFPPLACSPGGPGIAPLPPVLRGPACGPNLAPALVDEYRFPQLEAQNLLSGIWDLPGSLLRSGRLTGDLGKRSPCVPPASRWTD